MFSSMVSTNPENVKDFLYDRLSKNTSFSKKDITVTEIWYDWNRRIEVNQQTANCEKTRKITIKRTIFSKSLEITGAYFSHLSSIGKNRYKLDNHDMANMETAISDLFSEIHHQDGQNSTELKNLYVSCREITFLISLTNPEHFSGPKLEEHNGIAIASTAGKVSFKALSLIGILIFLLKK